MTHGNTPEPPAFSPRSRSITTGNWELFDHQVADFIEAVRGNGTTNSPVVEAHQSALLCHLGNIAQFSGGSIECDPKTGRILNNAKAADLWTRE